MDGLSRLFTFNFLFLSLFLFTSCSHKGDFFKIEGRFLNFNQGELYVYSLDGEMTKLDTIRVQDGRFAYETFVSNPTTLSLVFPNFSEQPIFCKPGKKTKIKADATHLKEMEVTGDEENELMTDFRLHISSMSPPEITKYLQEFVKHNPKSIVSLYLISKYLVRTHTPDYSLAEKLLNEMIKKNISEENKNSHLVLQVKKLRNQITILAKTEINQFLPTFTINTKDLISRDSSNTKRIVNSDIFKDKIGIITIWSSWNYDSQNIHQRLVQIKEENTGKVAILGISVDADRKVAKKVLERDNLKWDNVCDEKMWDSPLIQRLGIGQLPDNILINKHGKIVARNLEIDNLKTEVDKLLGKK